MDILLTGILIRVFYLKIASVTFCIPPATVTIETSFLVLQIEITGNFSLRSFKLCKCKEFPLWKVRSLSEA